MESKFNVFERKDYKRATEKLTAAVIEVAEKIRRKMYQLDLDELWVKEAKITLSPITYRTRSGFSYSYLGIEEDNRLNSLEDDRGYYYTNDFNCWIQPASNASFVKFANNFMVILDLLNEIETEKTNEAACKDFFDFYEAWVSYENTAKQANELESKTEIL